MVDRLGKADCCGCESCEEICPVQAIDMVEDEEGFRYPVVNKSVCINCQLCEKSCPSINRMEDSYSLIEAYACFNKKDIIRAESTSGGVFSLIASYLMAEYDAIVYGVCFNNNFETEYLEIDNFDGLHELRGSKYVQSKINDAYRNAKVRLEAGKTVLFSGLPCQIEAFRSYLGKEYSNLILIDMACFGIGSPGLWREHLKERHPDANRIKFKDKTNGWKNWNVKYWEGDKETIVSRFEDEYMSLYLSKINIRPSCFECKYKGIDRNCDFTMADCWGIGEKSELNDDKGLSALLLHTKRAVDIFNKIKCNMEYEKYDPFILMAENWAMTQNVGRNPERNGFFDKYKKKTIEM